MRIIHFTREVAMHFIYETQRLYLKVLTPDYAPAVLSFLYENREYFEPYETDKQDGYYTTKYQRNNLRMELQAFSKKKYIRFYVFKKGNDNDIIGTISFSNILPYPYSSASLGYKFDRHNLHMGYASEAVSCAVFSVFRDSVIHRIEAFVMPDNIPSIHLLDRIGFEYEGICKKSISICGQYKDHLRYALVKNSI